MKTLKLIVGLLGIYLLPALASGQEYTSPPNVILIVSDDHGKDALGAYGNSVVKTPALDHLAAEGVKYTNAYCTSASCAASRSVILTGMYGHATGSYGHTHDYHHFSTYDSVRSLPVILRDHGYRTARVGKYHLAPEQVYDFDVVLDADERSTVEMAEQSKEIIEGEAPFFLYFCPGDPHRGSPFKPEKWDDPNSFGNRPEGYPGVEPIAYQPERVKVPDFLPDTKIVREELAEYYKSVSRMDQGIGKLMEYLEQSGKKQQTIVIYISDNGIAFPGAKTTLYQAGIQLPCIVYAPGVSKKETTSRSPISWVDLCPTILDLVGISVEEDQFHGRSFKQTISDPQKYIEKSVYASHTFHEITMYYPMRSVIEGDMKLIWNIAYQLPYPFASDLWWSSSWQEAERGSQMTFGPRLRDKYIHRDEFELYDLSTDPLELNNLVDKVGYHEILKQLKNNIKTFQSQTRDPWMIMWDHGTAIQGSGVGL
ncbi:heparan N-sulfatase [Echinicola strongylocentroti]|uniref:Heparan N-sulfatase n=1 Tax=Echinicola strongylocentroti TaxID=1795355 RepID=A0A2Z4IQ00_9BACT|nr:sulfatase [Echinicola strongylocentroti]AWW32874.1 heparan N-sulfatase [Echinicola strongylocentroti]